MCTFHQGNGFMSHQAQNGSGKTAAFSLAVLSSIELEVQVPAVVNFWTPYPLVMTNIATENGRLIVGFPIINGDFP